MLIFLQKDGDSQIVGILIVKGIFSQAEYVGILTYQISSFQPNPNERTSKKVRSHHKTNL